MNAKSGKDALPAQVSIKPSGEVVVDVGKLVTSKVVMRQVKAAEEFFKIRELNTPKKALAR